MQHQSVIQQIQAALANSGAKPTPRPSASGTYAFRCIRHKDGAASAWFGEARWGCAACGFEEPISTLCESLGIEPPKYGYTIEDYSDLKGIPIPKLAAWGVTTDEYNGRKVVRIPYRDEEGKDLRARFRGHNGAWWGPGHGIFPYGLWKLKANENHPVVFVEGESDCHCAWLHGILCIGIPGASAWRKDWANHFRGRRTYVWQEPDKAGITFVNAISQSFNDVIVLSHPKIKDIADLHKQFPKDEDFRREFEKIREAGHPVGISPPNVQFDGLFGETLDRIHESKTAPIDAVPTPLSAWNPLCRDEGGGKGLARGWHIIIGGRPGFGKSVLGLNLAGHAIRNGESVCFCSLEMSQMQLATRTLSIVSGVPIGQLEHGEYFSSESFRAAKYALDKIKAETGGALYVNRGKLSTLKDIEAAIRYQHAVNGVRFVVVDYMQLAWTGSAAGILDRITEVSKTLRDLAQELNIVSVGLSQFNRETTSNRTAPPTAQGLMGGSVLENDADQIALLDHSKYEESADKMYWKTNVILDKNRHGRISTMPVLFSRKTLAVMDDSPVTSQVE